MRNDPYSPEGTRTEISPRKVQQWFGVLLAAVGVVLVIVGLSLALKLFGLITTHLDSADVLEARIDGVAAAIDAGVVTVGANAIDLSRPLALAALGCGALVLIYIAMRIIAFGVQSVTWVLTDRRAVQRIVREALGKPGPQSGVGRSTPKPETRPATQP